MTHAAPPPPPPHAAHAAAPPHAAHAAPPDAEVYAASAAENALPRADGKDLRDAALDLSDLSAALRAEAGEAEAKAPVVAGGRAAPEPADAPRPAASRAGDAPGKPDEQPGEQPEAERVLTKEEMVEEALSCPCIAAMRDGPCGDSFVAAYRCFLESETEPKGMDCMDQFTGMQGCMAEHPEEYNLDDDEDDPFAPPEKPGADGEDAPHHHESSQADRPSVSSPPPSPSATASS